MEKCLPIATSWSLCNDGVLIMNSPDLIKTLQNKLPKHIDKQTEKVVKQIFRSFTQAICEGERVEIRNFGIFTLRKRNARLAHNPKTGARVEVPAKHYIHFKPGKELRNIVNYGYNEQI